MTRADLEEILDDHPDVIEYAIHEAPVIQRSNIAIRIAPGIDTKTVLEELEEDIEPRLPVGVTIGIQVLDGKPRRPA